MGGPEGSMEALLCP